MSNLENKTLILPVRVDTESFRAFAVFDTIRRQRRWAFPVVFCVSCLIFSALCFSRLETSRYAALLGILMLIVALAMPVVYFYSFFASVRLQSRKMGLEKPVPAYTIRLAGKEEGIIVEKKTVRTSGSAEEKGGKTKKAAGKTGIVNEHYAWNTIHAAYRTKKAVYLYTAPSRALLMPKGLCGHELDEIWELLGTRLEKEKMHGK